MDRTSSLLQLERSTHGFLSASLYFFFSSRRRHTRYIGDWSSDVCSSDLSKLRPGNIQSIPESKAIADHAGSARVTRGADRARAYAQDAPILGLLRGRALAGCGQARKENS